LRGIRDEPGTLVIGAMTTQHELIDSDLFAASCSIIRETSLLIADPQVRYCGTLGGNLANGDPGNDMPAVMLALGAIYWAQGPVNERDIPAREYYRGIYSTALLDEEILTSIRIPIPADGHGWAYEKQKRKVGDYATAAAAVVLTMANGVCTSAAIALTNVADTRHCQLSGPRAPFCGPARLEGQHNRRAKDFPTRAAAPPTQRAYHGVLS